MRIAKTLTGWLCLLSLVSAVVLFGVSMYLMAEPFWNGATVYRLPEPDLLGTAKQLAQAGLGSSNNAILDRYVKQEAEPEIVWTGLDAAYSAMSSPSIGESSDHHNVVAAAVLDGNGRVVSAYPSKLIGNVFPFSQPIQDMEDSQRLEADDRFWYDSASERYPYWTSRFVGEVSRYVPNAGEVYLAKIKDSGGQAIGILAVVQTDRLVAMDIPRGSLDRIVILELRRASLFVFLLYLALLPIWVGMDAYRRGMRPFAWGALVAVTNVIGLGAYLVARLPGAYSCPNCGEEVLGKYIRCPACGVTLMGRCPICQTRMKPGWQYCPACNVSPTHVLETTAPKSSDEPLASRLMESTRANLCVTVLDTETGAPMPNARVSVTGRLAKVDGITSVAGIFEARKLRSGRYTITVTRAGYEPAEAELDIGEAPESVQLNLRALPSRIIGRVIERGTARPIAGVRVCIDSSRVDRSALTGAEGGFVLENIPAGPYTVAVDAVGFKHQTRLAEVAPGQQVTLDFTVDPRCIL